MIVAGGSARCVLGVTLLVMLTGTVPSGAAPDDPVPAASAARPTPKEIEKVLGPFPMGGQDYTVVLQEKRAPGPRADASEDEALTSLEIRDSSQTVVHRERFEYSLDADGFASSCSASAELLTGAMNSAILIAAGCLPSAPDSGATWDIFGVWNGNFSRLDRPFTTHGDMTRFIRGAVTKLGKATNFGLDVIELRIWTGNFHVIVPITLNWIQSRLMPPRCYEQTGQGMREGSCDLRAEVDRTPAEELTFIRLFPEPHEDAGTPRHVVVQRDSTVEILGARARVLLGDGPVAVVDVADDPWLHVRVDGKDGWIHTEEDFAAIGVPQAG